MSYHHGPIYMVAISIDYGDDGGPDYKDVTFGHTNNPWGYLNRKVYAFWPRTVLDLVYVVRFDDSAPRDGGNPWPYMARDKAEDAVRKTKAVIRASGIAYLDDWSSTPLDIALDMVRAMWPEGEETTKEFLAAA